VAAEALKSVNVTKPEMDMDSSQAHVQVCLTSISKRLHTLPATLRSLLAQDYPNFTVTLYLSREPFLLDEGVRSIPAELAELTKNRRFELRYTRNIGSYRKLLPFLSENIGSRRLVATADDDTIYPDHWLSELVQYYEAYRCVIAYRAHGMVLEKTGEFARYRRWMTAPLARNPDLLVIPTGKDGVLYSTSFFHENVLGVEAALKLAPTADDIWFKWHTAATGVACYSISLDYAADTFASANHASSLYGEYNRAGKNDETVQNMVTYGKESLGFAFG
jgi:hypothetical protein